MLSIDPQFASRWFSTRLPRLSGHPAGANLEIRVEERRADFVTDGADLGVRYGLGHWPDVEVHPLFSEVLFPVCSPSFAARHPIAQPADLLNVTLLRQRHRPWSLWFKSFGLSAPEPPGVIFDDSLLLIDAAAQGLGVALGRSGLVEQDLAAGRLVRPLAQAVPSEWGYYVVWRADSRKLPRILALRDWLMQEAGSEPDSP